MADGEIIISAKVNASKAEAGIDDLQSKLEKFLTKLDQTIQELSTVNSHLAKANLLDEKKIDLSNKIIEALSKQNNAAVGLEEKYNQQQQTLTTLVQQHEELKSKVEKEGSAAKQTATSYQAIESATGRAVANQKSYNYAAAGSADTIKTLKQELSSVERQISRIQGSTALADKLEEAKAKAAQTGQELDKVFYRLEAQRRSSYGIDKENSDLSLYDKLEEKLVSQQIAADNIEKKYNQQQQTLATLIQQHETLKSQLTQEQNAAEFQNADAKMQSYFGKQESDIENKYAKIEQKQAKSLGIMALSATEYVTQLVNETRRESEAQEAAAEDTEEAAKRKATAYKNSLQSILSSSVSKFGKTAFSGLSKAASKSLKSIGSMLGGLAKKIIPFNLELRKSHDRTERFRTRLKSIVSGALIFNVVSSALRDLTQYMGNAIKSTTAVKTALSNLKGAAATAAAPLIQALAPALAAIANAAATAFSYLARLISFFTGKSIGSMQAAAAGLTGVGNAAGGAAKKTKEAGKEAKKARGELAAFDELDVLNRNEDVEEPQDTSGGGGGGAGGVGEDINYGFVGESPFLQSILDAIKASDWYEVGRLVGEKLRDSLNAIDWPSIQEKAYTWAYNLAETLNGFVETPGLWQSIGHTLAQGLNTATGSIDTFFQNFRWQSLGLGLGNGLQQMVVETDWETLGRSLTDGIRGALLTLNGFLQSDFDWAQFGTSIGTMIGAAVKNIDWVQAAGDFSSLAIGLLTALNSALSTIDWEQVGQTVLQMLSEVDWNGILEQLGQVISNGWPILLGVLAAIFLPSILSFVGTTILGAIVKGLGLLITGIITAIGLWPALLLVALIALAAIIIGWLVTHWDDIKQKVSDGLDKLKEMISNIGEKISTVWDKIWTGISETVEKIWTGIKDTVKGAVNGVIEFINGMINAVVSGINSLTEMLNSISIDLPEIMGGGTIGFDIPQITAPQIPYLAQGAVIPPNREFLAVLGDQSRGTNIEAPLDTIKQAVLESIYEMGGVGGQEITIRFAESGGLSELVRLMKPYIDQENTRRGTKLITGGAY